MGNTIKLIVGLGNPGSRYQDTRHNAGAWFLERLIIQHNLHWSPLPKHKCQTAKISNSHGDVHLLLPTTYMNESGQSVCSFAQFYQIPPEQILVVHDELDLEPGVARLKFDGGHGGHNGLRDIFARMSKNFYRLRIGIGHPGHRDDVSDYVLSKPSLSHKALIEKSIENALDVIPKVLQGEVNLAMNTLNQKQ